LTGTPSIRMVTDHVIPELDSKGLRKFALVTGGILVALFGLFVPWLLGRSLPLWPWLFAGVLAALAAAVPRALRPIYSGWMRFGMVMSRITTPLIIGVLFFLVICPVGAIRRLIGEKGLAIRLDRNAATYRTPSAKNPPAYLERPF
jgi:Saxitoxin biosynthesis operon protein SxtJ